jgi:hypothetical protein
MEIHVVRCRPKGLRYELTDHDYELTDHDLSDRGLPACHMNRCSL